MKLSFDVTDTLADELEALAAEAGQGVTREDIAREAIRRYVDQRRGAVYTVTLCGMDDTHHRDYDEARAAWGNAEKVYIESLIKRGMSREDAEAEAEIDVGLSIRYTQ